MKLEFLAEGSPDCPLIRLYDFGREDALKFRSVCDSLQMGAISEVGLQSKDWIQALGGCELRLKLGKKNLGVVQISDLLFECILDEEGWAEVSELSEPLCTSVGGFQWLTHEGNVSLLFSPSGRW